MSEKLDIFDDFQNGELWEAIYKDLYDSLKKDGNAMYGMAPDIVYTIAKIAEELGFVLTKKYTTEELKEAREAGRRYAERSKKLKEKNE